MKQQKFRPISILLIVLVMAAGILGQGEPEASPTPPPFDVEARSVPVTVTQGFVDDANEAFLTVAEQRSVIEKFLKERTASDAVVLGQDQRITGLLELLQEYALADSKDKRRSFWAKAGKFLNDSFKALAKPENIRSVIDLIVLIKILERQ